MISWNMDRIDLAHRRRSATSHAGAAPPERGSRSTTQSWPTPRETVFEIGVVLVVRLAGALAAGRALAAFGIR